MSQIMEIDLNNFRALFESVQSLHKLLDAFEQSQTAQHALNVQRKTEIHTLHALIANLAKPVRSFAPAPAPTTTAASITATAPAQQAPYPQDQPQQPRNQPPSWIKIIQRPASGTNKRRREHALRTLQPPRTATNTPSYSVLHLHRSHRMSHAAYRSTLAVIGIDSRRILDITFPARNVSTILINVDYKDDIILKLLTDGGITQIPDFNPLDPKHVADIKFKDMATPQLARIAAALHTDRCIRTLRFIKQHTVPGVIKFLVSQNWINMNTAQAMTTELLPRPTKRNLDPNSNIGQLLMQPAFADKLCQPVTKDLFGNVVSSTAMEITEEFHPDAHDSDSDATQE